MHKNVITNISSSSLVGRENSNNYHNQCSRRTTAIQWNIRGYRARRSELQILARSHTPDVICLQETLCRPNCTSFSTNYNFYCLHPTRTTGWGGVAIAVMKEIPHVKIHARTSLQAIAIRVNLPTEFTYVSLYIPPSHDNNTLKEELRELISQLPKPFVIMGDLNAHSEIWGGKSTDTRGKIVVGIIGEYNLTICNDDSNTFFCPANGNQSAIDLTLSSNPLSNMIWNVDHDLHGSDHFPIFLSPINSNSNNSNTPKWIFEKANWEEYQNRISLLIDPVIDYAPEVLSNVISSVALSCIPRSSDRTSHKRVPWWNEAVAVAIKNRRRALRSLRRLNKSDHSYQEALLKFRKERNNARKVIEQAKQHSWRNFVEGIDIDSSPSELWKRINTLQGRTQSSKLFIKINGKLSDDPVEVSEALADHFVKVSSKHTNSVSDDQLQTQQRPVNHLSIQITT